MRNFRGVLPHFQVGKKEINFPDFTITMLRTHHLPPTYARFRVPLNFNKLDMRDYLFHAYGVRVVHVSSSIFQGRVYREERTNSLKRHPSQKKMTVQLTEPFLWPEDPWVTEGVSKEEWAGFDKRELQDLNETDDQRMREMYGGELPKERMQAPLARTKSERTLAEQAAKMLRGEGTQWKPTALALGKDELWKERYETSMRMKEQREKQLEEAVTAKAEADKRKALNKARLNHIKKMQKTQTVGGPLRINIRPKIGSRPVPNKKTKARPMLSRSTQKDVNEVEHGHERKTRRPE